MKLEEIKATYELLEQGIQLILADTDLYYLDAFVRLADDLLSDGEVYQADDLTAETVEQLTELYQKIDLRQFTKEEVRQVVQLVLLKSYRQEKIQANHQMTPDSIGVLLEYLVEKITQPDQKLEFLDITVGTGNLLATVMNRLEANGWKSLHGVGVDNDDTLLAIASLAAQFEDQNLDLYHQDAIDDLPVANVDVVVSDLPVGYYPLDERVQDFATHAKEGHSYVHHLLIEQALNALRPGGFGLFVIPRGLFESAEAQSLIKQIQAVGYLQGLLNLPEELFASKQSQKSILLLQKKGSNAQQVQQVLLGDFPSFKDQAEFGGFLTQIEQWIATEKLGLKK